MPLSNTPIQRKLITILLLTSGAVLFLTCAAFFAYEFFTFRQSTVRQLSTLGEIIAANSTAALAFDNQDDAKEILFALQAERHIVGASLYNKEGKPFSHYPPTASADTFPAAPEKDGYRFERSYLAGFQPVTQNGKRLGTLYLRSDMGAMYERFRLYGGIALLVIVASLLVAYVISRTLQRQISQPILALAETARCVSERRDYSVRATKLGQDELGLLTDAFNHMLTQIQEQNQALSESEVRVRAVLNSALSAVLVIDAEGRIVDWNARAENMFGWTRREALGLKLADTIIPHRYREPHRLGIERFLATGEGPVVNRLIEMSALRRDGSEFPVELSVSPLKTGNVVSFCGFITDITERKRAEEEVRQSEARYRTLFNTLIEGFCIIEVIFDDGGKPVDYRFLEVNPAFERQTGLHNAQGRLMRELAPDHEAHWFEIYGKIALTGEPLHFENEAKALGRHYDVCAYRVGGPEGRKVAILFNDITERKRLEEVRERFAAIVESSDDAIISKTLDGVITSWNAGAVKLFGYSAQEALGKPMMMLFPPDRGHEEPEIIARISRGESVDHFETVRVGKDGKRIDVSVTISPIRNSLGKIFGASTIARDITDRKQAEARIQAQLGRLNLLQQITRGIGERQDLPSILQVVIRSLEDNLPIDFGCVCLYEPTAELLTVTSVGVKSAALAMELALTEQARIPIDQNGLSRCVRGELVHEPDITQVKFPFPQRLVRGGLHSLVAAPLLVESTVFGVLIAARREANSFSSPDCEFLRQLSEHVALAAHQAQTNSALQQAYNDLRQSQQAILQQERLRALGQMASGIAHDINNAISPVALYTESLLEREANLSVRGREYLTTIQNAIEDVTQTVARMREFYRQREPELTLAPVHFNQLIQQVLELTRARWNDMPQERGLDIRLQTELASDLPPIMGAEGEIRDALTNLILNAVDAMPQGGTLTLRTRAAHTAAGDGESDPIPTVVAEVSDSGVGMDEETKRRCLEPFFTTKGERGTGLGLAMVYGMVERHSAELEVDSKPGRGTTMRLVFPVALASESPSVRTAMSARPAQRLRILIVDDDPLVIKSLRDTLEGDGHLVTAADGGQAGINAFQAACQRNELFAVVITDLGMPYVDGRKVAASIKAISSATPVILLTGWGQRLVAEGDIPPHVDRVLNKPPKLREVRAALAELVSVSESSKHP